MDSEHAEGFNDAPSRVPVWDVWVRLFHWTLVGLIAAAWTTAEQGGLMLDWHMRIGYAIITLVLFRIGWGMFGSRYARFADFLRGPRAVWHHFRHFRSGELEGYLGHTPPGGWMVVTLLTVLLLQAGMGLFANDDILSEGPLMHLVSKELSDTLTGLHEAVFNVLLALVVVHVAAVVAHRLFKGENLVRPMITGRKVVAQGRAVPHAYFAAPWRALAWLAFCAGAVYLLIGL